MKVKKLLLILFVFSLSSCYNPYKGFDGVDDKGMGRTPPSMQISKEYKKQAKKQARRHKRMMKKRKKEMGTPEHIEKIGGYKPL